MCRVPLRLDISVGLEGLANSLLEAATLGIPILAKGNRGINSELAITNLVLAWQNQNLIGALIAALLNPVKSWA